MSKRSDILLIYKYFIKKMEGSYKESPEDREILTNFLIELHLKYDLKCIGRRFFFDYITYQFIWYKDSQTKYNKFSFKNIFGKSSLQRFISDEKYRELKFIDEKFRRDRGIRLSEIFPPQNKLKLRSNKDRARFHNTPGGLTFCLETTTLYDKSCIECMTCNYKNRCKRLKKSLYAR